MQRNSFDFRVKAASIAEATAAVSSEFDKMFAYELVPLSQLEREQAEAAFAEYAKIAGEPGDGSALIVTIRGTSGVDDGDIKDVSISINVARYDISEGS